MKAGGMKAGGCRRGSIRFVFAAGLLLMTACASTALSPSHEAVFAGKVLPSAASVEDCRAKGGIWRDLSGAVASPPGSFHACIIPTTDGGKACSSATDCQSMCVLAPGQSVHYGDHAEGRCMADYFTGGCRQYVHRGRYAFGLCSE